MFGIHHLAMSCDSSSTEAQKSGNLLTVWWSREAEPRRVVILWL